MVLLISQPSYVQMAIVDALVRVPMRLGLPRGSLWRARYFWSVVNLRKGFVEVQHVFGQRIG